MKSMLVAGCLLLSPVAFADAELRYRIEGSCPTQFDVVQVSGSQVRIDMRATETNMTALFDGSEDLVTYLMHDQHRYQQIEVDEDALDYTTDVANSTGTYIDKQMQKMQGMLQQQCAQAPKGRAGGVCANMPDMKQMMQMLPAAAPPKVELRVTDRQATVAGVACSVAERWENGVRAQEECHADPATLAIAEPDRRGLVRGIKVMQRYGDSFKGMTSRFKAADAPPAGANPAQSLIMSQVCYAPDGSQRGSATLVVGTPAVPATRFEIPAGYQRFNMQEGLQQ